MDFIDHLIYTTNTNSRGNYPPLRSDNVTPLPFSSTPPSSPLPGQPGSIEDPEINPPASLNQLISVTENYAKDIRENFVFYQDSVVIDKAIQKHWFDMVNGPIKLINTVTTKNLFRGDDPPLYHLIFAYLIENTRITQIMERLIYLYQHDEILGIASSGNPVHQQAFQWIVNTEDLFFKTLSNTSYRNITSNLRPNPEASRRNAYYRMFGMDLAFGDPANSGSADYSYYKAKTSNKEFILLFEQFLAEIWQAYINAQNTSGANTTDYQRIIDMAIKLREMLMARRGGSGKINLQNYRFMNLSKEEYSSVGFASWLFFIISYDSPLVTFLGCQANTASERLMNIGRKVGIEAHKKAQALFDMAAPMATILREIEFGLFELDTPPLWIRKVIESQIPGVNTSTTEQKAALIDLLTVINNWEKATGHRIKNPEGNITGTVRVQQNGVKAQTAMN
jgi:hypothetical protein